MELRTITTNLKGTHKLGEQIGKHLKGNETFALIGELGSGKTSFAQGIVKGLKVKDNVLSPTFVLERIYKVPKKDFDIHHFDLYRVGDDIRGTGLLDILDEEIVLIEWPEKVAKYLPDDTIRVEIKHQDENSRGFIFKFPSTRKYLFEDIKK